MSVRKVCAALFVTGVVLSGCDSPGEPSPAGTSASSADAAAIFEQARAKTLAGPTGVLKQETLFGGEPDGVSVELEVSYDLPAKAWRAIQWYREPARQPVSAEFIFTPEAAYVTTERWPEKWHGRWVQLPLGADQDGDPAAPGVPNLPVAATVAGEPMAIQVLRSATAVRTEEVDGFRFLSLELPAAPAAQLAGLNTGLREAEVDPASLEGVVLAVASLDDNGGIAGLTISEGAFDEVEGLPQALTDVAGSMTVQVSYDQGFYQEPTAPAADQLLDPAELD